MGYAAHQDGHKNPRGLAYRRAETVGDDYAWYSFQYEAD